MNPEQYYRRLYERTIKDAGTDLPAWHDLPRDRRLAIKQLMDEHAAMIREMARVGKTPN